MPQYDPSGSENLLESKRSSGRVPLVNIFLEKISQVKEPKLNQKKLNEIPIPCPDGEMLERLLNIVASAKEHVENILLVEEKKTNELKKLKSAILVQELQSEAA